MKCSLEQKIERNADRKSVKLRILLEKSWEITEIMPQRVITKLHQVFTVFRHGIFCQLFNQKWLFYLEFCLNEAAA